MVGRVEDVTAFANVQEEIQGKALVVEGVREPDREVGLAIVAGIDEISGSDGQARGRGDHVLVARLDLAKDTVPVPLLRVGDHRVRTVPHDRGRDVVTDELAAGAGEPGQLDRTEDLGGGGPVRPAVDRGDEPRVELARVEGAAGLRVVVVGEGQACRGPTGRSVDTDPRDEVVDRAVDRIDRDPDDRRPGLPVLRGAHHDVVGGAARPEPAVRPDHVDLPLLVDLGRGECRGPKKEHAVVGDVGDRIRARVGGPTVTRHDHLDRPGVGGERHDHSSAGLGQRLPTEAVRRSHGGLAPRLPAVARGEHLDQVAMVEVVHLCVAVPVVRALRPVVACDPRLVVVRPAGRSGDDDGLLPRQPSVERPVHEHGVHRVHGEALGHPDVVLGLVGDGGIADPGVRARRVRVHGRGR